MKAEELFARYLKEVDDEMRSVVPAEPAGMSGMIAYHLGWADEHFEPANVKAGKMLRPTLCLLCCEAAGGDYRRALPAAAALELLHNFSLVHDDVEDRSLDRRHRRTVWAVWGEAQAINVGDAIYALAHQALYRLIDRSVGPAIVLAAARRFDAAAVALCAGQYRDMWFESRNDVTIAEYVAMVGGKTAALLGCSAALGGLLGSEDGAVAAVYERFGESLGVAFQIQDDILGIWGDPRVTGKPAADDVRSRKKGLPVAYALESASGVSGERLRQLYSQAALSEEQVSEVIGLLDEVGARQHAERLACEWYGRALDELDGARPLAGPHEELRAVAEFLVGRSY